MLRKFDRLSSAKSDSEKCYAGAHSPTRAQLKFPF